MSDMSKELLQKNRDFLNEIVKKNKESTKKYAMEEGRRLGKKYYSINYSNEKIRHGLTSVEDKYSPIHIESQRQTKTIEFFEKSYNRQSRYMCIYTVAVLVFIVVELVLGFIIVNNISAKYEKGVVYVAFMIQSYAIFHTMVKYIFSSHNNSLIEHLHKNKLHDK